MVREEELTNRDYHFVKEKQKPYIQRKKRLMVSIYAITLLVCQHENAYVRCIIGQPSLRSQYTLWKPRETRQQNTHVIISRLKRYLFCSFFGKQFYTLVEASYYVVPKKQDNLKTRTTDRNGEARQIQGSCCWGTKLCWLITRSKFSSAVNCVQDCGHMGAAARACLVKRWKRKIVILHYPSQMFHSPFE